MTDKQKNLVIRSITGVFFVMCMVSCFLNPWETSERNRGESRGVRTEVSSASESRGRQPGERTEVREPDVP